MQRLGLGTCRVRVWTCVKVHEFRGGSHCGPQVGGSEGVGRYADCCCVYGRISAQNMPDNQNIPFSDMVNLCEFTVLVITYLMCLFYFTMSGIVHIFWT